MHQNYDTRYHCSVLAEDAIKAAVRDYKQKKGLL